ncbi:uncharacterized protein B0T23DRAFT_140964 [Neurospora hispaniola]|uniref:Uncharacterized protein n=1 Tax=Neurospora hispaniola TaxID=588809 RepID=A0AAJ0I7I2_9PEZI|nr:hypothetical protein B0T23DRAFT_140964 [Neurospora hispaniola]
MVEVFRLFYFQVCPESTNPNRPTLGEQVGGETKVTNRVLLCRWTLKKVTCRYKKKKSWSPSGLLSVAVTVTLCYLKLGDQCPKPGSRVRSKAEGRGQQPKLE